MSRLTTTSPLISLPISTIRVHATPRLYSVSMMGSYYSLRLSGVGVETTLPLSDIDQYNHLWGLQDS